MLKNPNDSGGITGKIAAKMEQFKSWLSKSVVNTKMAATAMLPRWENLREGSGEEGEQRRGELQLEKIDQVMFCVKNCFINEDSSSNESGLREVINETLSFCFVIL